MSPTVKQEAFCQAYIQNGGNATEAYKSAYNAEKMKAEVVHVKACELLKCGKVSVRVKELRDSIAKRHELTVDDIIAELEEARKMARNGNIPNPGVMVTASMGKAKVAGLLVDKVALTATVTMQTEEQRMARIDALLAKANGS